VPHTGRNDPNHYRTVRFASRAGRACQARGYGRKRVLKSALICRASRPLADLSMGGAYVAALWRDMACQFLHDSRDRDASGRARVTCRVCPGTTPPRRAHRAAREVLFDLVHARRTHPVLLQQGRLLSDAGEIPRRPMVGDAAGRRQIHSDPVEKSRGQPQQPGRPQSPLRAATFAAPAAECGVLLRPGWRDMSRLKPAH